MDGWTLNMKAQTTSLGLWRASTKLFHIWGSRQRNPWNLAPCYKKYDEAKRNKTLRTTMKPPHFLPSLISSAPPAETAEWPQFNLAVRRGLQFFTVGFIVWQNKSKPEKLTTFHLSADVAARTVFFSFPMLPQNVSVFGVSYNSWIWRG